ncbi:MAG: hypothetical protein ACM3OC_06960 [Deltaproteobacteria bacterium]
MPAKKTTKSRKKPARAPRKRSAAPGKAARKAPAKAPVRKARTSVRKAKTSVPKVIGTITHYFPKVRAAVLKLKIPLAVGEKIRIKGHTTDFSQNVASMQIDHVALPKGKKGDIIGLQVMSRVRRHDVVTKP